MPTTNRPKLKGTQRLPQQQRHGKARISCLLILFLLFLWINFHYFVLPVDEPMDNSRKDNNKDTTTVTTSIVRTTTNTTTSSSSTSPPSPIMIELRFDWTNLELYSPIAKRIEQHQSNCSLPIGNFYWRKGGMGLGSELHVWSAALCNAFEEQRRIRTFDMYPTPWVWIDREKCDPRTVERSSLACYFPHAEMKCRDDDINEALPPPRDKNDSLQTRYYNIANPLFIKCDRNETSPMKIYTKSNWRAAGVEYLFSRVSPLVAQEAQRQLQLVFSTPPLSLEDYGSNQTDKEEEESSKYIPLTAVPKDLITVHVRWGDKRYESDLEPMANYFTVLERLRVRRGDDLSQPVSILLCTEDPQAVQAFVDIARNQTEMEDVSSRRHYIIYMDQFYRELSPHRLDPNLYNAVPIVSEKLKGKLGLWSLGSLLVAMEANAFVLTMRSNWSRLMDELRRNVLNPRCNDCTLMEDVNLGVFMEW